MSTFFRHLAAVLVSPWSAQRARRGAQTLLATALLIVWSDRALAAFTDAELTCRVAIATSASKLATIADKTVTSCHKQRDRDAGAAATDCNDITQADAVKHKVAAAIDKLTSSVGGARDHCADLIPANLGYYNCPSPCDAEVPVIASFADVADCESCLVQEGIAAVASPALGSPAPPLGMAESKCHSALSKTASKLLEAVVKARTKCQRGAEKDQGVEDLSLCIGGADPAGDSVIAATHLNAAAAIDAACQGADLSLLDSCDSASLAALHTCVLNDAESNGESVVEAFFTLDTAGPTTTTTTTTTTLPPATWTGVQGALATKCGGGCHTGASVSGGLGGLDNYDAGYANLVNADAMCGGSLAKRVLPGDSANSLLMHKLDWTQDCGATMPFGGAKLSAGLRDVIRAWIDAGALKN